MNSPEQWIGRLIGDQQRYRLEKLLGSGGMGQVFLAKDTLLGKQVALKLLRSTLSGDDAFRQRFEREVSVCAALSSEHIVRIDDYGITSEGYPFFVMERLVGETLGQRLQREKRLSINESVSIITQVCTGLKIAHEGVSLWRHGKATDSIKVIHRDLKPENIFLVPTGLGDLAKILDFGIAKVSEDQQGEYEGLTGTDMFIGTFDYAAPEQVRGARDIDGRTDIYSLGMILYRMLSGADPFGFSRGGQRTSGIDWAVAHATRSPEPLRSQPDCESLPLELEAVVMRCLAKNPEERYGTVDELCRVLRSASRPSSVPTTISERAVVIPEKIEPIAVDQTRAEIPILEVIPDATHSTPSDSDASGINAPALNHPDLLSTDIGQPEVQPLIPATMLDPAHLRQPAVEPEIPATIVDLPVAEQPVVEPEIYKTQIELAHLQQPVVEPEIRSEPEIQPTIIDLSAVNQPVVEPQVQQTIVDLAAVNQPQIIAKDPQTSAQSDTNIQEITTNQKTVMVAPGHVYPPHSIQPQVGSGPVTGGATAIASPKQMPLQTCKRPSPLLVVGGGIAAVALLAGGAFGFWTWQKNAKAEKLLTEITDLHTKAKFDQCLTKGTEVATTASNYSDVQVILNQCRVGKAQELVTGKKFVDAIAAAKGVPAGDPSHSKALDVINQAANRLLEEATAIYETKGQTTAAIALLKAIPATSSVSSQAQAKAKEWQQETNANNQHLKAAKTALQEGRFQDTIREASKITTKTPYWQRQQDPIISKAEGELDRIARAQQKVAPPAYSPPAATEPYNPPEPEPYNPPPAQPNNPPPQQPANGGGDLCQGQGILGNCP